jgi:Protein of unknown function (DUF551)
MITKIGKVLMREWIRVSERLPEVGDRIWGLFCKRNGEPRKLNPVRDGEFHEKPEGEAFCFGYHYNYIFSVEDCPGHDLTHWQPRTDDVPPSPLLGSPPVIYKQKKSYDLTPEERKRRGERGRMALKEYWRKRKGETA